MDQGNIRIFTLMYGVVFNGLVDIGALIWDHMIELIPDISSSRIVNYHRFWCAVIAHAYTLKGMNASEGDGANVLFSNLHYPKFSNADNEKFLFISRIPTYMLKQVPSTNVLIQAYMANPENAYKSRPTTDYESRVVKETKKGGKKGSSSVAAGDDSPAKKTRRGKKQSEESSEPSPDLLAENVPKRKRGHKKPTPRIPSPVVEDSEETEDDVSLKTKKRRKLRKIHTPSPSPSPQQNSPPSNPSPQRQPTPPQNPIPNTPPHHSSGHEYVLKDLEGIFPDFVESPQHSVAAGPADDFTFVVKKDFNELVNKVDGMQSNILSFRTSTDDSFKAAAVSNKALFDEVLAIHKLQVANQQIMAQNTNQLAATQKSLDSLT
ncbi:hypothetical protein E9993_22915, partial [Labilibacter sediminis]